MSIEWWRDLVIIVAGVLFILIIIGVTILGLKLYSRINFLADKLESIVKKLEITTDTVQGFTTYVTRELARPIIEIAALFSGLKQGLSGIFRKKGG